jgi:hypothetical protein
VENEGGGGYDEVENEVPLKSKTKVTFFLMFIYPNQIDRASSFL